jgi:hypothetical protein
MDSIRSVAMPRSTIPIVASCIAIVSAIAGLALATGSWSHGPPIPGTWPRPPDLDGGSGRLICVLAGILVTGLGGLRVSTNALREDPRARSVALFVTACSLIVAALAGARTARTLSFLQLDWQVRWSQADYLWALAPFAALVVVGLRAPGNAPAAIWALSGALAVAALAFAGHALIVNVVTLRALPAIQLAVCGLMVVLRRRSFRTKLAGDAVTADP